MINVIILEQNRSGICIDDFLQPLLPPAELEIRRVWNSLPIEVAKYFALLDQFTLGGEIYAALGEVAILRIYGRGLKHVGDVAEMSAEAVAELASLDAKELRRLTAALAKVGLTHGSDVSAWREYRQGVAPTFRLRPPYGMRLPQDAGKAREV